MRLFLLVGQSNMAGRGKNYTSDNAENSAILKLDRNGQWASGVEPVHFDKPAMVGACLATSFARAYLKDNPGETVGLVPCAFGGSSIDRWVSDGDLFKEAVRRAHLAEKDGQVIGILWHQGEAECGDGKRVDAYRDKLVSVVRGFRKELGSDVTFVAGGLGDFLANRKTSGGAEAMPHYKRVNDITRSVMSSMPRCAFASAEGLDETIGDSLHFSTPSLRAFGERYYRAWKAIANRNIGKYLSRDYSVKVGGKPVEVIRTPDNEKWKSPNKGLAVLDCGSYSYGVFTLSDETEIEVASERLDLSRALILPESKGVKPLAASKGKMTFRMKPVQQLVIEPTGRKNALVLAANPRREDDPKCGSDKVRYFGPGYHRPGFVELGDNESVYLAEGAWVEGLIYARGKNITISGPGVISGAPYNWIAGPLKSRSELGVTSSGAVITMCGENLTIRDTTIYTGWVYNLAFNEVTNAVVDNVKVISNRNINDDGIDPCRTKNLTIRNSFVHTQDDCIAPKYWVENLLVENCILWTDVANIIRVGFECEDGRTGLKYCGITMRDLDVVHMSSITRGLSNFWARAIVAVEAAKGQVFENLLFENIRLHECPEGWVFADIRTRDIKAGGLPYCRTDEAGYINGIVFRDIHLKKHGCGMLVGFASHDAEHPITGARFENVTGYGDVVTKGKVDFK